LKLTASKASTSLSYRFVKLSAAIISFIRALIVDLNRTAEY
jgi:hypothetical protein